MTGQKFPIYEWRILYLRVLGKIGLTFDNGISDGEIRMVDAEVTHSPNPTNSLLCLLVLYDRFSPNGEVQWSACLVLAIMATDSTKSA
jgi:hypothetical protein